MADQSLYFLKLPERMAQQLPGVATGSCLRQALSTAQLGPPFGSHRRGFELSLRIQCLLR